MYPSMSSDGTMSYPTPSAPPQPPPPFYSQGNATLATVSDTSANHRKSNVDDVASSHSPRPWSTGLCDCCSDVTSCCLTCWCPCIAFGRIAEIVDRGTTSCGVSGALYAVIMCVTGCSCMYSCFYRSKLRGQYFLDESPCNDCCVHCCFEQCALCQEYRMLKNQGFDMSLGWYGNLERRKLGIATPPAVQHGMKR